MVDAEVPEADASRPAFVARAPVPVQSVMNEKIREACQVLVSNMTEDETDLKVCLQLWLPQQEAAETMKYIDAQETLRKRNLNEDTIPERL